MTTSDAALVERIRRETSRLHLRSSEVRPVMEEAAATIEAQARRIEYLDGALRIAPWNEMRGRGVSQDQALAAINKALASPPLPDTGLQA